MTTKQVQEIKKIETAKIEALEKIVVILEKLKDQDEDAHDWVIEKINEE